ncbi:MAG: hypothetical protein E7262_04845 [Lachnospiraceae bacterium]|nr:hypothetical protein [Lachnospiraceae bacterium]
MNENLNEELGKAYKELHVSDPYSDTHDDFMKEFDEPVVVKLSDQSKDNLDKFFAVDSEEVNKSRDIIKTLSICVAVFIAISIAFVLLSNKSKLVEMNEEGIKNEEHWTEFKTVTSSEQKEDDIIVKIYEDGELESELKLKFDGEKYSYGDKGKKYKYLLDESGTVEGLGLKMRLIVLSDEEYTFDQLYNSLYNNVDETLEFVDLDELKGAVGVLNQTLKDIDGVDDTEDTPESDMSLDELDKVKYQLIYYY